MYCIILLYQTIKSLINFSIVYSKLNISDQMTLWKKNDLL